MLTEVAHRKRGGRAAHVRQCRRPRQAELAVAGTANAAANNSTGDGDLPPPVFSLGTYLWLYQSMRLARLDQLLMMLSGNRCFLLNCFPVALSVWTIVPSSGAMAF